MFDKKRIKRQNPYCIWVLVLYRAIHKFVQGAYSFAIICIKAIKSTNYVMPDCFYTTSLF